MNPRTIVASIWHFRHEEAFTGQLFQVCAGVFMWSLFAYLPLKFLLLCYESGKGADQKREIERESDEFSSRLGWYRTVFCLRLAITIALITEGNRFGGGWPSILLFVLGAAAWYGLSPERRWMRR